ncbi:MAG TPA: alpha/beta fold hydrolase, partial [Actinomycetes bacterium]|nr:alpha/beta fold hydrolase [Actinomycetes bacterium]
MFDGFSLERVDVGEAVLRVRHGGSGPAVLLLHGHPRTHATWHRVAPLLAGSRSVVCPDLRGYGESSKPPTTPDHAPYSKRAMAADCLALMAALGHDRFAVVGHDRGAYVALRTALDHPAAVTALAVLDAVPIGEALARADARFAAAWWHWFFFGQTAKPAERVISADPDAWYRTGPEPMGAEAYADYRRAIHDPATVHAMMEDYRAGLGVDRRTTTRTAAPVARSPARPWSCGPPTTTWATSTATSSPSGASGPPTCGAGRSPPATTWPRRP